MSYLGVRVAHTPSSVFLRVLSSSCRDPITGLAAVAGNATRTTTPVIVVVLPSRSLSLSPRDSHTCVYYIITRRARVLIP